MNIPSAAMESLVTTTAKQVMSDQNCNHQSLTDRSSNELQLIRQLILEHTFQCLYEETANPQRVRASGIHMMASATPSPGINSGGNYISNYIFPSDLNYRMHMPSWINTPEYVEHAFILPVV